MNNQFSLRLAAIFHSRPFTPGTLHKLLPWARKEERQSRHQGRRKEKKEGKVQAFNNFKLKQEIMRWQQAKVYRSSILSQS
eukprot:1147889-Pelagomonas_calceolata.AAC.5